MKRYNEEIIYNKYDRDKFYAGMVRDDSGKWVEYSKAQERENKLIDMIYKSNDRPESNYCPESMDLETDYKYKKDNCNGDDVNCRECFRISILKELDNV